MTMTTRARIVGTAAMATALVAGLAAPPAARADGPTCSAWDVEYALNGNLKITDTPMGAGDGVYPVGPGRAVIRFEDKGGQPGGHAKLTAYSMHEHVSVTSSALMFKATVVTDTNSKTGDGVATEGNLAGQTLTWGAPVTTYRSDGTMNCEGNLCGKFGAPPLGSSPIHMGPRTVQLAPFAFGADFKTFSMTYTMTSQADSPKQTTYSAISGREMKRTCVP
jgi:hypothetical protein